MELRRSVLACGRRLPSIPMPNGSSCAPMITCTRLGFVPLGNEKYARSAGCSTAVIKFFPFGRLWAGVPLPARGFLI